MPNTHSVANQPPPFADVDLFTTDAALTEAAAREGAGPQFDRLSAFGALAGSSETIELGFQANRNPPVLRTHDRFGHRIDEVDYHPAYHELMRRSIGSGLHALPWQADPGPAPHVTRAILFDLMAQVEAGHGCPLSMTYSVVPALNASAELAAEWVPRIASTTYDPRAVPAAEKAGVTFGMAMTEKQGGSDVRANTTTAEAGTDGWRLTGHKWFCSAPMSDAFLVLAYAPGGMSCFLVPRRTPDGERNVFAIQRLKDKLGDRSNASSEVEFDGTWGTLVGEEGRGVQTILEMVGHTRLDCVIGSTAGMRQATAQAIHHATHRAAFGRDLIEQPLMRNVLADLVVESEAATHTMVRLAGLYDDGPSPLRRIATAIAKYWVCRRQPDVVREALECLGGNGFVEESIMPRLFRQSPLNAIWEGSGNVICLDVLRTAAKEPEALVAFLEEIQTAKGADARLDRAIADVDAELSDLSDAEARARRTVERLALAWQGSLLVRHAPESVADAFCASRLGGDGGRALGTLPAGTDLATVLKRGAAV